MRSRQLDSLVKGILGTARLNNVFVKSGFGVDEETLFRLKSKVVEFGTLYASGEADREEITSAAADIEGLLLQSQTLGILDRQQVDAYIDILHQLVKGA